MAARSAPVRGAFFKASWKKELNSLMSPSTTFSARLPRKRSTAVTSSSGGKESGTTRTISLCSIRKFYQQCEIRTTEGPTMCRTCFLPLCAEALSTGLPR